MKKIGLFYQKTANKTSIIAQKIIEQFGADQLDIIDIATLRFSDFDKYENLIFGVATWFEGEFPTLWDEIIPGFEDLDFSKKKVAIFGLGDQQDYSDCFADAVGHLAQLVKSRGAKVIGRTSTEGYSFDKSVALEDDGMFAGLILDFENQSDLNDSRVIKWIDQLKKEFI